MIDTRKKDNPAIACADLTYDEEGNRIAVEQGNYGPSKNEINTLAEMEISVENHYFELQPNGNVSRVSEDGRKLPDVENPKENRTLQRRIEEISLQQHEI